MVTQLLDNFTKCLFSLSLPLSFSAPSPKSLKQENTTTEPRHGRRDSAPRKDSMATLDSLATGWASPRASRRANPRVSPRASPRMTIRPILTPSLLLPHLDINHDENTSQIRLLKFLHHKVTSIAMSLLLIADLLLVIGEMLIQSHQEAVVSLSKECGGAKVSHENKLYHVLPNCGFTVELVLFSRVLSG